MRSQRAQAALIDLLTDENNRDPISGFPVYKALLCEVEKAPFEARRQLSA